MHDPHGAFRHVAFSRFAASYVLAIVGSQVLSATIQWDVYQRTKDPLAIGLVGLISAIPVFTDGCGPHQRWEPLRWRSFRPIGRP